MNVGRQKLAMCYRTPVPCRSISGFQFDSPAHIVDADRFMKRVEIRPRASIDCDTLHRQCFWMLESQQHRLWRIARLHLHGRCDLAMLHVGYDLISCRAEMGGGILHRNLLALLQPCPRRRPRQPERVVFLHHKHIAEPLQERGFFVGLVGRSVCRVLIESVALLRQNIDRVLIEE